MMRERPGDMARIEDIVREIGRQQGENVYYRTCYHLLKHLQDLVDQVTDELLRLHISRAEQAQEFAKAREIANGLRSRVRGLVKQE